MVHPSKKAGSPESTLVEDDDSESEAASSSPTVELRPINPNAQTIPVPAVTPVGKRPTSSAIPAQRVDAPTLPPDPPKPPERRRTSSKRAIPELPPEEPTRPIMAWQDPPVPPPVSTPRPPTESLDSDTPVERMARPPPPVASPKPPLDLIDAPTPVTPVSLPSAATPARGPIDANTRLNPFPQARQVVGPSGTLDTDGGPPSVPLPDPGSTFTEDEPAQPRRTRTPMPLGGDTISSQPAVPSTHDYKPASPRSTGTAELDERSFQRWLIVIAAGGAALVVLAVVLVFVKFEEPPPDVGVATPLAPVEVRKPAVKDTTVAPEAPRAVMIEQQVDAGGGSTRTVMAAAGTVRIVTDPDCTVTIEGKDMGMAPVLVTLPAGRNAVVLENKKLFFKRTVSVDVLANEQTAVRFAFSQGWIELDAPKGTKVTIDGRPASGTHVQVWEGTHKVEAVHADRRKSRAVQTVEVASGMTTSVHFDAPSNADD